MSAKRVLLVEGPDDQHVVWSLCVHHNLPKAAFEVESCGGVSRLIDGLVRLKTRRGEEDRVGVVIDADEHLAARWAQLRERLKRIEGIDLPATPAREGTVVLLSEDRLFGVWLMPDNEIPGMLEDFIASLRPSDDVLLPQVDEFLRGLPTAEECPRRYAEVHRAKARMHAFLAIQREPGKPLGQAISARFLDGSAPQAVAFVAWLQRLFIDG